VLVNYFMKVPLRLRGQEDARTPDAGNPFEVEWWLRLAQKEYEGIRPALERLHYTAQEKERRRGSESTLVALRLTEAGPTQVKGDWLAFGDSCALLLRPPGGPHAAPPLETFPLTEPAQFDRSPICLPSSLGVFNRQFHGYPRWRAVTIQAGSVLILATDAVSRWIISAAAGKLPSMQAAFQVVANCAPGKQWEQHILGCRDRKEMIDDDCTALVIRFQAGPVPAAPAPAAPLPSGYDTQQAPPSLTGAAQPNGPAPENVGTADSTSAKEWEELGVKTLPDTQVLVKRQQDLQKALGDENRALVAVYWGDGWYLKDMPEHPELTPDKISHARAVANALREVIAESVVAQALKPEEFIKKMQPIWNKHGALLLRESCAATIRKTLADKGIVMAGGGQPTPQPAEEAPDDKAVHAQEAKTPEGLGRPAAAQNARSSGQFLLKATPEAQSQAEPPELPLVAGHPAAAPAQPAMRAASP
jgi:hypothetical protein